MKTKSIFISLILFVLSLNLFAQTNLSKKALDYIDGFNKFKMETTAFHNDKNAAAAKVKAYKSNHPYSDFSTQEKLIIDTFILLEEYNYTWEDKANDARLQKVLMAQIEKNEAYIAANEGNTSGWLYTITADCFSCYMSYNPISGALKYGLKLKKYYETCLKLDPDNSMNLTHLAQWYYWAPVVNGGSIKKAISYCQSGVEKAKTPADKFYAEILLSQILYENKDKTGAKSHLAKAKTYCPNSEYVKELEKINDSGYSLFSYNKKKAEDDNRVNY